MEVTKDVEKDYLSTSEEELKAFSETLNSSEVKILERLCKLRGRLAFAKSMKPYQVFRNVELFLLMKHKPKTIEELGKIKGFPPTGNRVSNYGSSIVAVFNSEVDDFEITRNADGIVGIKPVYFERMKSFDCS